MATKTKTRELNPMLNTRITEKTSGRTSNTGKNTNSSPLSTSFLCSDILFNCQADNPNNTAIIRITLKSECSLSKRSIKILAYPVQIRRSEKSRPVCLLSAYNPISILMITPPTNTQDSTGVSTINDAKKDTIIDPNIPTRMSQEANAFSP